MELNIYDLFRALLEDVGCGHKTERYILQRLRNEGAYFATNVLPAFSKHLLQCIEHGKWSPFRLESSGVNSSPIRERQGLPVIFRGYLLDIFERTPSGYILKAQPCPVALFAIRQVCEYYYKLSLGFDESTVNTYTEKFVSDDAEVLGVGDYDAQFVEQMRKRFHTFYTSATAITPDDVARHAHPGPGTFSGCDSDFWMRNYQHPRIRHSYREYAFGLRVNKRSPMPSLESTDPSYSEVLFVPKDSRGPRVIVREPYDSLLIQMGYNTLMSEALERDTHYRINFKSQSINRRLALSSSITRRYATLDLKDASDRVSNAIVMHLFRYVPLIRTLRTFRTRNARLPSGQCVQLKKLSGMGSGFTFPTMALVIHLAICTHISRVYNLPYRQCMSHCYVYGDDIIVPTHWYEHAVQALQKVGLRVNSSKSYRYGPFRESCGGDYLHGNDVAPVRLRLSSSNLNLNKFTLCPSGASGISFFLLGLERHARELVKKQLYSAAAYIYSVLEKKLGKLPLVTGDSPVLGRYTEDRDAVLATLKIEDDGSYAMERLWAPSPKKGTVRGYCPHQHLKRALSKDRIKEHFWYKGLFPAGVSSAYGDASLPRRISLRCRKHSGFVRS